MLHRIAALIDRFGFRRPLASLASLAYRGQQFSVSPDGYWVNQQESCTIVSPSIHTAADRDMRAWVMETWAYGYTPKAGDVILDIGAGVGEEAVVFSRLVGSGKIYAIEAHPDTYRCLADTLKRSGIHNVTALQLALADTDGVAYIDTGTQHVANSILSNVGVAVARRSLDSLAAQHGIGTIDFLRMNIEGAEKFAICGMTETIKRVANLCISCHDFIADRTGDDSFRTKNEVCEFLESNGFDVVTRPHDPAKPWVSDYLFGRSRETAGLNAGY